MSAPRVRDLGFLVGRFVGEGLWGGLPFHSSSSGRLVGDRFELDVEASQARRGERRERVVIRPGCGDDGVLVAEVSSGGEAQRFIVTETEPARSYVLAFTPPVGSGAVPQRWTIERREDGGYRERYEIARNGMDFETSVECVYHPEPPAS